MNEPRLPFPEIGRLLRVEADDGKVELKTGELSCLDELNARDSGRGEAVLRRRAERDRRALFGTPSAGAAAPS